MAKTDYRKRCAERWRLRQWYAEGLGRWLLESEQQQLDQILPNLFGYHLIQVGHMVDDDLLHSSRISHRVVVDGDLCRLEAAAGGPGLLGRPDALPLQRDSVDVVVLPHILEFEAHPHEVLREVERVLVAEGHVVILGFNPWSLWGLWRLLRRRHGHPPWYGTFRSVLRLKDWLALLGFDIIMTCNYFYRPPLRHAGFMRRLGFLERLGKRWWPFLGGAYVMVAKKRVVTLTPIKPRWRPRRRLVQVDLARRMPHQQATLAPRRDQDGK